MLDMVGEFLRSIVVFDCGTPKVRVGSVNDGGYVVLEELCGKAPEVYSFGVGDNVDFEQDFVSRWPGVEKVYLFDPTIEASPSLHPKFFFIKCGIGGGYSPSIAPAKNSILKMDIESDEWEALLNVLSLVLLLDFSQLVIEFHIVHAELRDIKYPYWKLFYDRAMGRINDGLFLKYFNVINRVNTLFRCFHIHANNSLHPITVGGHTFPPLLEMSFVRKDLVRGCIPTKGPFPVDGLDAPNKTDRADIYNYFPMGRGQ